MNNYLVSIIVPAFNVEKYIDRCLKSLINQSYENIEIIVINDGSTDNTKLILEQYQSIDSRIKIINQDNAGMAKARNAGIEKACGKFIACVDSDDYVDNDYIGILVNAQMKYQVDIVCCSNKEDYDGNIKTIIKYPSQLLTKEEALRLHLSLDNRVNQVVWGKLIKKDLFSKIHFIEGRWHEDTAIVYQLVDSVDKVYYLDYDGYYYVQRNYSIVHLPFNVKRFDKALAYYEMSQYFKDRFDLNLKANNLFVGCTNYVIGESYDNLKYVNNRKMILSKLKEVKKPLSNKCKLQRLLMLYVPFLHKMFYKMKK